MWFGDLVTMRWWNGIWLNEAFATFMELLCVDAFRPDWRRWVIFGIERDMAMATDSLHSTRPVEYPVGPPEEAEGMFDVLTYQKGGRVLRMLEQYLGRRALPRRRSAATSSATPTATPRPPTCGTPSNRPAANRSATIMDTWIFQGGFPLVTVATTTGRVAHAYPQPGTLHPRIPGGRQRHRVRLEDPRPRALDRRRRGPPAARCPRHRTLARRGPVPTAWPS